MDVQVIDGIIGEHNRGYDPIEGLVEPYVGMEFDSEQAAVTFYDLYAKQAGFSTRVSNSRSDGIVGVRQYVCFKDGLKRRNGETCEARLQIELKAQGKWVVTKFVKEHIHSDLNPSKLQYFRPRRHFAGVAKHTVETYPGLGTVPSGIMCVPVDGDRVPEDAKAGCFEESQAFKGLGSLLTASCIPVQKRTLGKDAQNMLDYFKRKQAETPGFYYAIQLDKDDRLANVFWSDARSRTAYSHFGDTVTLDTVYIINQYKVPFAPFTGVNHHGQTILFGCALLLDESESTFLWLFKTFLAAMDDRAPVSIVTDRDRSIHAAVTQVLPNTRHCLNKWGILRECRERIALVCHKHQMFQVELHNCINLTQTVDEFEVCWDSILEKYDLRGSDWLHSLYDIRRHWVPVYFRSTFFAAVSPNQGFENSFFDGYVTQQTSLSLFFRQYERALESSFEKEVEADLDTIKTSPVLKTPSPMEIEAANVYTRRIFSCFQEELVETFVYTANRIGGDETISTYRVAKFEDDHKSYIVSFSVPEIETTCSCHMFEFSGILCRHILTVFTVTNILTMPSQYILKRWTRNAKTGIGFDDRGKLNGYDSMTIRYNHLYKEAIKCAEEGSIDPQTYNIVLSALKEAVKKVGMMKKDVVNVASLGSQLIGVGYDSRRTSTSVSDTPALWPLQDRLLKQFNPNSGSILQSADLSLPHPAHISLHQGDNPCENRMVLPCLKSMTWTMENKSSTPENRVAIMNLKLQDFRRNVPGESDVKFHLSRVTLEPMLKSMAYISEQFSSPANKAAVINLKLQDTEATLGESEVKFQVSKDTLGAMLRSMAYIREQLTTSVGQQQQIQSKKQRR